MNDDQSLRDTPRITPVAKIVQAAKRASRACAHVEEEWLANELGGQDGPGSDLDAIQDALGDVMYPEQYATPWEQALSATLHAVVAGEERPALRQHVERLLAAFETEQEHRLEARIQMEAFRLDISPQKEERP